MTVSKINEVKLKKIQDVFSIKLSSVIEEDASDNSTIVTIQGTLSTTFLGILLILLMLFFVLSLFLSGESVGISILPAVFGIGLAYMDRRKSEKKFSQISSAVFETLS